MPSSAVWAIGDPPDDGEGVLIRLGTISVSDSNHESYLPFTAEVRKGFSGGPLVNDNGEVVGVIDAKTPRGQALAVPVDAVRALIQRAEEPAISGRSPWVPVALIGASLVGGAYIARRAASRRNNVRVRLGAVRHTAAIAARLEER
jgi:S1-C subfamily serine protease